MSRFISCDWGTTNLRMRLVDCTEKTVIKETKTTEGVAATLRAWQAQKSIGRFSFFCSVLEKHIAAWETPLNHIPVLISGMASSSIGMQELPYFSFPFHANGSNWPVEKFPASADFPHPVYIITGACTNNDVMRGEETLLAGCDSWPNEKALYIFPGTHSKHIIVTNGIAKSLTTYMTGEFFELLSLHSVLSASVQPPTSAGNHFFEKGIQDGSRLNLLHGAFGVRVNQLFKKADPAQNFNYLSGLLIGAELKEVPENDAGPVVIVAGESLLHKYVEGLKLLRPSCNILSVDADMALLNGHCTVYRSILQHG